MKIAKLHESTARLENGGISFFKTAGQAFRIDPAVLKAAIPANLILAFDFCEDHDSLKAQPFNPSIQCEGYGCVTVLRVPSTYGTHLAANVSILLDHIKKRKPWAQGFSPNVAHGNWRCAFADDGESMWAFIVDGCMTYCNYGFLLNGTPGEIKPDASDDAPWTFEASHSFDSGRFLLLSGDENSDSGFASWLADNDDAQESGAWDRLRDLGWIEPA